MADISQGNRLEGKVAVVTGAGSGFGAAIAKLFAAQGGQVVVADINVQGGEAVASAEPSRMHFLKLDVTSLEDWKAALDFVNSKWGHVDVLVNNAGTSYRNKPTLEVTQSEFDRCINVNVASIYHSVNVFVPKFIEQKTGASVINVSSIGSERPRPGLVWYNASKGAVSNATKGLAAEFGQHNIRFNNLCPLLSGTGLFETFVGVPDTPENRQKFIGNVPLGRLTDPNDVAYAALYLASDEGAFITGVSLEVDGGRAI
ncbi:uncharacterized protein A1O9_11174 [Exophiala aquamarina CBS 119918]|uniref:3-oxoacyl-[acyl-carrier protein] reductase n=1 Tax=Exophiala aquamarina CBS 119918 TaxID=1182545 RepID=A0A072NZE1_9EURO|nr:uncharacterized protein A1O9_11174 [Exophiala aquamarina CBS 119918]KEF52757.1 hypothetical protein A1O9_11174 [Exophiala aquamarina CBS 119918]